MTPTDIIKPGDEARDNRGEYNRRWRPVNFSIGKTPADFPHLDFRRPGEALTLEEMVQSAVVMRTRTDSMKVLLDKLVDMVRRA